MPLLLGLPQLRELGAVIDLTAMPEPTIQFSAIGSEKVTMGYGSGGHLLLDIGRDSGKKKETRFPGETIEVFHELKAKDFNIETTRIMKSKLRNKFKRWLMRQKTMAVPYGKNSERGQNRM